MAAQGKSDLAVRTLVGLLLIAVALAALWLGGFAFWLLSSAAGLLVMREWASLIGAARARTRLALILLAVPLVAACPALTLPWSWVFWALVGAMVFAMLLGRSRALGAGLGYVGLAVLALLWIRSIPQAGFMLALWSLGTVWATDIGAYFAGRSLGGPKLSPRVSPNKTWSGLIGGMVAAALLGAVLAQWAGLSWALALASPGLAVLAQGGDLLESAMKRRAGVKDSGTLLPGHGGAFDRLDGVLAALPVAALLIALLG